MKKYKFIKWFYVILLLIIPWRMTAQQEVIQRIFREALTDYTAYHHLQWLTEHTAGRICSTPEAAAAVEYTYQLMKQMDLDSVWLQPVQVRSWDRGEPETGRIISLNSGAIEVPVTALGWSIGTGNNGITAHVVEVRSKKELQRLNRDSVAGKLVFFNQPMDPAAISTFSAYGGAVWQRTNGPVLAAKLGAAGCLIRSLSIEIDDIPHTGITRYQEGVPKIPAVAVSTRASNMLSRMLKSEPGLRFYFRTTCKEGPEMCSYNVIGEIRGADHKNQFITIGGHLDAWDTGQGAQDDGGGCMQAIEVLRLFKKLGITPRHTIRAVMFMDEEVAQRGGQMYAKTADHKSEVHLAALESDRGVFRPMALAVSGNKKQMNNLKKWAPLFKPYQISLVHGGGGTDVGPLKKYYPDLLLMGLIPDDQRYFTLHHSAADRFETVNRREMQLGSAAIASLVYLFDQYGL